MGKCRTLEDMLGRSVTCPVSPQRIVSLCPSITETLFSLSLDNQIAGVTRYCLHPEDKVSDKPRVGGTKRLNFDAIDELKPDLIIAEKEENNREDVERLAELYPVYVTEVRDLQGAHEMVRNLGSVCGRERQAIRLSDDIQAAWSAIPVLDRPLKIAYLIWRKPFMAAGQDTYIDAVLQRLGLVNVFADVERYPEFTLEHLKELQPDVVFLSSEPYPFSEKHQEEVELALPFAEVLLVDGEAFSWYGSHMLDAARYFSRLQVLLS